MCCNIWVLARVFAQALCAFWTVSRCTLPFAGCVMASIRAHTCGGVAINLHVNNLIARFFLCFSDCDSPHFGTYCAQGLSAAPSPTQAEQVRWDTRKDRWLFASFPLPFLLAGPRSSASQWIGTTSCSPICKTCRALPTSLSGTNSHHHRAQHR